MRNAKVPTSDTMIDSAGMNVDRRLWRKTYTTRITRMMASIRVLTTFLIEASRKSFELIRSAISIPFGRFFVISATSLSICSMISLAFEPEVWAIIQFEPGCPFTSPM